VAEDGSLQYRCKDGDNYRWIKLSELSSEPPTADPATQPDLYAKQKSQYDMYQELMKAGLFVDIGMGVRSDDATTPPQGSGIDRNSVFTYTLPGIEITGVGTITSAIDGRAVSANIYDLLGEIADNFASSDYTYEKSDEMLGFMYGWEKDMLPRSIRASDPYLPDGTTPNPEYDVNSPHYKPELDSSNAAFDQTIYDNILESYKNISAEHQAGRAQSVQYAITNVGTKMQFLEFVADSMSVRELDNKTQQMDTESISMEEAIIYFDAQKITYQAALSMGAQVIPMSIFNYMS
jgi:hypothetical protein